MNHWILAPVVLPAVVAPLILMGARYSLALQRTFSIAATLALAAVAIGLLVHASNAPPEMYRLGNWPAPFGIVLVLDRLSALMVVLTSLLAVVVLVYAAQGWDGQGRHFHTLFQFQLMGLNGAFLTGDIFNLFVFFEVLLIASYGLMVHSFGAARLKAGVQYVLINLAGSTLFLVAVAMIYSVTGTLNMADLAVKVPRVAAGDQALLQSGALLLLVVFGVKAALVPLHFWLPGTYAATTAPVAALFAIMTKVGAYSIIRVFTLVFGDDAGAAAWIAQPWLIPAALVTLALGTAGVLAAHSLRWLICFAVVASMGTLLVAVGLFTEKAMAAGLYYLVHSTLAGAALFLIAGLIDEWRGQYADTLAPTPRFRHIEALSGLFFLAAVAAVGMPPLSGFVGKLLILDGARGAASAVWIWAMILGMSLLAIIGFARAGSQVFWRSASVEGTVTAREPVRPALSMVAAGTLIAGTAAITILAGPVTDYMDAAARQLFNPADYIRAVLGPAASAP